MHTVRLGIFHAGSPYSMTYPLSDALKSGLDALLLCGVTNLHRDRSCIWLSVLLWDPRQLDDYDSKLQMELYAYLSFRSSAMEDLTLDSVHLPVVITTFHC